MSMLVTNASEGEGLQAIEGTIGERGWELDVRSGSRREIKATRGVSLFSWGDDIGMQILQIRDVVVVHATSSQHYGFQLFVHKDQLPNSRSIGQGSRIQGVK